jgi:hypothetical protein
LDTPHGAQEDVTSTLSDLERKLVDLERELQSVAGDIPSPAEIAAGAASAPAAAPEASLRIGDLRSQIGELVRFRDQLQTTAQELVDEYGRLVERLQVADEPLVVDAPDPGSPAPGLVTAAPGATITSPPDAVLAPVPGPTPFAPPPTPADDLAPAPAAWGVQAVAMGPPPGGLSASGASMVVDDAGPDFEGAVVVDAGPFRDITTLSTFEQALARVPGAEDVYVRSFEGDRAVIDLRLQGSVPLLGELKNRLSLPITVREARDGRLSVDVGAESHGT